MTALDVVSAYLARARVGDWSGALAHMSDDVVGHVPGRSELAGELHGKPAVSAYIEHARKLSADRDVELQLQDMLVSHNRVALIVREIFHRDGREIPIRRANVYRVAGEQIVEITIYEHDQYAVDELFA